MYLQEVWLTESVCASDSHSTTYNSCDEWSYGCVSDIVCVYICMCVPQRDLSPTSAFIHSQQQVDNTMIQVKCILRKQRMNHSVKPSSLSSFWGRKWHHVE